MPMLAAAAAAGYQERLADLQNPEVLLDWGDTNCYAGTGTTFNNLGSAGNTYDGDLVGGAAYSANFGGIITTDGSNDHIQLDTTFVVPRAAGTAMVWFRTHSANRQEVWAADNSVLNMCSFSGTNGIDYAESSSNCNNYFAPNGANSKGSYTNEWYCVFVVANSNRVTWYEMGDAREFRSAADGYGSQNCGSAVDQLVGDIRVGRLGERSNYIGHTDADYGVIALWDQALTHHEAKAAFGCYRHRYGV